MDYSTLLIDLGRFFFASLFLLFLPGFAGSYALFPRKGVDLWERFILAVSLSAFLTVFPVLLLDYVFNRGVNFWIVFLNSCFWMVFLSAVCVVGRRLKKNASKQKKHVTVKKNEPEKYLLLKALGVVFVLVLNFFLVYSIHNDYGFPFHTDEWIHLKNAVGIIDLGSVGKSINLEIGFALFLAEFFLVSGVDPVTSYQVLPAFFMSLTSLMLFASLYKLSGKYWIGLFSMLFFAGLKSNITIMGPWFFVALTMCFPLLYSVFYLLGAGFERGSARMLLAASLGLLAISLIHPCSASFVYPIVIVYLLSRPGLIKKNILGTLVFFSIPFFSFIYFFKYFWKGSINKTIDFFLEFIVMPVGRYLPWEYYLFLPQFYGTVGISLAAVGIFAVYAHDKNREKIIVVWALVTVSLVYIFYNLKYTLLSPYERLLYYALLSIIPLSGIGLYHLLEWVYRLISKKNRYLAFIVCASILLAVCSYHFSGYDKYKSGLYRVIDSKDYAAIAKLSDKGIVHKKVLAQPHTSFAVYAISRNYVVATSPRTSAPGKTVQDVEKFFGVSNCTEKAGFLKKYAVDYVYSPKGIDCTGLKEIYRSGGRYIYRAEL